MRTIIFVLILALIFVALSVGIDSQGQDPLVTVNGPLMAEEYFLTLRARGNNDLPSYRLKVFQDGSYEVQDQSDICNYFAYRAVRDSEAWLESCSEGPNQGLAVVYNGERYTSLNLPDPFDIHGFHIDGDDNVYAFTYDQFDGNPFGFTIQKQSSDHVLLWQWSSRFYIDPNESSLPRQRLRDYAHINSVDTLYPLVLVSLRNTNSIVAINEQTNEIEWRVGGVKNSFTPARGTATHFPCRQHTARFLAKDTISVFDNGNNCRHYSRGVVYQFDYGDMVVTQIEETILDRNGIISGAAGSYDKNGNSHLFSLGNSTSNQGFLALERNNGIDTEFHASNPVYVTYQINRRFAAKDQGLYLPIIERY